MSKPMRILRRAIYGAVVGAAVAVVITILGLVTGGRGYFERTFDVWGAWLVIFAIAFAILTDAWSVFSIKDKPKPPAGDAP